MAKFTIGTKVQSIRYPTNKGIIIDYNSSDNRYRVKIGLGIYDFLESELELVQIESKSTSGPKFKIGDCISHQYIPDQEGTIIAYGSAKKWYQVKFKNQVRNCYEDNLSFIKAESQDEQYNKDSFNYAVTNLQPEVSQNIESVICDCGITSANVGGNHSQWCRSVQ